MKFRILVMLLLTLITAPFPAHAQKTIHGRVTDSGSGEGLPSAHVAIIGQRAGTVTNDEGKYQLEIPAVPVKVRFSSIGYYSKEMEITADSPDSLDAALAENPVLLEEVVVTDEDPAVRIMREVIRRKQVWQAGLETYSGTGYSRVTIGNGKRNVMKVESVLDVAWDKVRGFTVRHRAQRQTGKTPSNSSDSFANLNLYDDYVKILEQRIPGVTHPDALDRYTFKLTGQRKLDGETVYDIAVEPRNRYDKLLAGRVSILDGEFAMIEAKLHPTVEIKVPLDRKGVAALRKVFLPPPRIDVELTLEQQFDNFGGDCWLPIGEKSTGQVDLGWKKLLAIPPVRWEEVTRFSGYTLSAATAGGTPKIRRPERNAAASMQVEVERGRISIGVSAPDPGGAAGMRPAGEDSTPETAAVPADSTLIRDRDFIPPAITFYTGADSTTAPSKESSLEFFQAFRPTGIVGNVLARRMEKGMREEVRKEQARKAASAKDSTAQERPRRLEKRGSRGLLDWSILPDWAYNRVDGNDIGLKLRTTAGKRYTAEVLGLYQTERKRVAYDSRFIYPLGKQSRGAFEVRASDGTAAFCDSPVYSRFVNSVLTLFGDDDYFDYYRSIRQSVGLRYALAKRRIDFSGSVSREKHLPLDKSTDFNLPRRDITQRENPPSAKGRLGSVLLSLGYGDEKIPYLLGNQRRIEFTFEYADPGLFSSDFSFRKYRVTADWRLKTLFRGGLEPNTLDVRIMGMVSDGDLPIQRFGRIDSRLAPLTPYGTFRALRAPLAGEQLCAVFWEHNFKTVPFEMLRLDFLARRGMELILQGASGRTWISGDRLRGLTAPPGYLDRFHHELGVSVNNIYAGLRVDLTKDLDRDTATWGIGYKRPF